MSEQPSRLLWSKFSQALSQLVRRGGNPLMDANCFLAESMLWNWCKALYHEDQESRTIIRCIRGIEGAAADYALAIIRSDLTGRYTTPPKDASPYAVWNWARQWTKAVSRGEVSSEGVQFVPLDAKLLSLSLAHANGNARRGLYSWSSIDSKQVAHVRDDSEVILAVVEGISSHVAVLPTAVWFHRIGNSDLAAHRNHIPIWLSPFMVHVEDLCKALLRIANAALGHEPYLNPSLFTRLESWRPRMFPQSRTESPETGNKSLEEGTKLVLDIWDSLAGSSYAIDFNPVQPWLHDFYISTSSASLLRIEVKSHPLRDLSDSSLSKRKNPLAARRIWHCLLARSSADGFVCVGREERDHFVALTSAQQKEFLQQRCFATPQEALRRYAEDSEAARRAQTAARRVAAALSPLLLCAGLPQFEIDGRDQRYFDPLQEKEESSPSARWLEEQVQLSCMELGRGVLCPLGSTHPRGPYAIVAWTWRDHEKRRYLTSGEPPIRPWSKAAALRDVSIICLLSLEPTSLVSVSALNLHRSFYTQTVSQKPYVFYIGTQERPSNEPDIVYLIPSQSMLLGTDRQHLPEPNDHDRSLGQHFWYNWQKTRTVDLKPMIKYRELRDPVWPSPGEVTTAVENCMTRHFATHYRLRDLRLRFVDAVAKVLSILHDTTMTTTTIQASGYNATENIRTEDYRCSLGQVHTDAWRFGHFQTRR